MSNENLRFSPKGEPRKIFVDIDETICFFPPHARHYDLAEPSYENIAKINKSNWGFVPNSKL